MVTVIPRWEWRTFGEGFGEAEERIRSHGEAKARTSAETYVLSADSANNTKVRDGLMDIKRLQEVNADLLEQWNPVLKAAFPLPAGTLAEVFAAWGVPVPELPKASLTLEELLAEVVAPHPRLRAVAVDKERYGFTVDGTIVEIADLRFDGRPIRTAAVEHEDPALVIATVRKLGLDRFENVNYIRALKRHAGIPIA